MGHGIHPRDGDIVRKALGSPPMMVRLWMWRSLQTLALIEPLTDINWHPFGKALNQVGELTIGQAAHAVRLCYSYYVHLSTEAESWESLADCEYL